MTPYYDDGQITIYNADCHDVLPTLDPSLVNLVLTDPPYGIDYARTCGVTRFTGGVHERQVNLSIHGDADPFDPSLIVSRFGDVILFGANAFSDKLPGGSWIVWDKRSPSGSKNVMSDGEVAWFSRGHGVYIYTHMWDGFNRASERGTAHHPTQKPVALMRWILEKWSKPGDLILDPYMGSGPIARACADLGRRYIGIEIDNKYCEVAVKRLQQAVLPLGV